MYSFVIKKSAKTVYQCHYPHDTRHLLLTYKWKSLSGFVEACIGDYGIENNCQKKVKNRGKWTKK